MKSIPIKNSGDYGYPIEFDKDMIEELQNCIETSNIVLADNNLNQFGETVSNYVACSDFYIDNGIVNKYVLNPSGTFVYPKKYINGMRVRFYITNTNTGASTIEIKPDGITSLGIKSIKKNGGAQELDANDLTINTYAELYFSEDKDCFIFLYINSEHNINGNIAQIIFNNKGKDFVALGGSGYLIPYNYFYYQYNKGTEISELETSITPIYNDSILEITLETSLCLGYKISSWNTISNNLQLYMGVAMFLNPTSGESLSVASTQIGTTQHVKPNVQNYWTFAKPIKLKYHMQNTDFDKKIFKFRIGYLYIDDLAVNAGKITTILGSGGYTQTDAGDYKTNTVVSIVEYAKT